MHAGCVRQQAAQLPCTLIMMVSPPALRSTRMLVSSKLTASAYVQAIDIDSSAPSRAATHHSGRRHNPVQFMRFLACAHPWIAMTPEESACGNSSTLSAIRSKPATQARATFCSITHRPANKCCCVYSAEHAHTCVRPYATRGDATELYKAGAYRRTTSRWSWLQPLTQTRQ